MHWDANEIFKLLPFYGSYIEKPKVKKLNNVQLLKELPFSDKLSIVKNKTSFSDYAQSYKIEIVDKRDVIVQLKTSEISIKEFFKDLLIELKGFKYHITLAVLLSLNCIRPNRITKKDREIAKKFLFSKKDYNKILILNKININVFRYENKVVYSVYLSDQCFNDALDFLFISNDFTSHYVYIKDFNRLIFNKTKNKNKKYFCKSCLQCFSSEKVLEEHRKDCLMINCEQNVKLEKGFMEFKNFNRKKVLTLNKPIYVGFCIAELSKLSMYQFHYNYVLKTFNNVKLLFTDTDSLVYEIKNDNVYEQCFKDKHLLGFSGYPKGSIYYCNINKKS